MAQIDVVDQVVGVLGALQHGTSGGVLEHAVGCDSDGGSHGGGQVQKDKCAGVEEVEIHGWAATADVSPELVLCDPVEVALHGDLGIGGRLPLQCLVRKRALDGPRGSRCHRTRGGRRRGLRPAGGNKRGSAGNRPLLPCPRTPGPN